MENGIKLEIQDGDLELMGENSVDYVALVIICPVLSERKKA